MRIRQWLSRGILRVPKRASAVLIVGSILACMAMAQMHLAVHAIAGGRLEDRSLLTQIICGIAMMGVAGWIVLQCERDWTQAGKLDWASFRKHGWTWSRTAIVLLSLALTAVPMSELKLTEMSPIDAQRAILIAAGYAMWCATGLAVLWSLACRQGGNGWPLQGAPVPLVPRPPSLHARRREPAFA